MDVDKLEHVQKRATKLIPELSKKSYSDWLKTLKLPTLKYRRYRGDIVIYIDKVVQYIYVSDIEAIEACIRFLDEDDDIKIDSVSEWPSQLHTPYNNSGNKGSLVSTLNCNYKSNLLFC